ncbi:MAG: hypothetical protein FWC36_09055 [Spirochaetes bacterium]|nr:hypothetical protein [Spirochaetota bacterium]
MSDEPLNCNPALNSDIVSHPCCRFFPRINYSVFILHVPELKGKELYQAVYYKLKMLYPGNLDDTDIIIKKNGKQKHSHLVFLLPKDLPKSPVPLPTLLLQQKLKGKTATALFISSAWIEIVKIEQGAISESIVKRIDSVSDIRSYIETFCNEETSVEIFYEKNNSHDLEAIFKVLPNHENVVFRNIEDFVKRISFDSICIYSQYSPKKKYIKIGSFAFALVVIFFTLFGVYQYKTILEEKNKQLRAEQLRIEKTLESERIKKQRLATLEIEYMNLIEGKRLNPFEVVSIISSCLDRNVLVTSLTIMGNSFQMEAVAQDSLKILRNFEKNRQINNLRMNQIHPYQNRERFSLNGAVLPVKRYVPEDNSIEERIKILEALIREEKQQEYGEEFTAALFGMTIRDVLRSSRCAIKSYQYLGYGNEREIEFSLQANSRNFFNFLKISSMPLYNWDFSLVQIRNLAPRDALDVVIRIKANFDIDGSNNLKSIPVFPAERVAASEGSPPEKYIERIEKEIAEIARNYFAAPPRIAALSETRPRQVQEPERMRREVISWLAYAGVIRESSGAHYIFMRNTRDGRMLRFELNGSGNMSCKILDSGNIEVVMDNRVYEVRRER